MNLWEDEAATAAVVATGRRTLVVAGLLTEACVSFPVLSALAEGYRVLVVADACGGLTQDSHWAALQRTQQAGAVSTSWLQVCSSSSVIGLAARRTRPRARSW